MHYLAHVLVVTNPLDCNQSFSKHSLCSCFKPHVKICMFTLNATLKSVKLFF